jgi:hypothetical protein
MPSVISAQVEEPAWQNVPERPGVVADFPPHWRSGVLVASSQTYLCRNGSRTQLVFDYSAAAARNSLRLSSMSIDGNPVGQDVVAELNAVLADYPATVRINPQCLPERMRVHVFSLENGSETNSRYVDIAAAGQAK